MTTNMDEALKVHGHAKFLDIVEKWLDSEWDLFLTIKDWVDVDYENRKQHLDSLMSHVRFSLLTPAQLKAVRKMDLYSEGSWWSNVQVGEDYHSRPIHRKMMRPTSVRSKPQAVCFEDENCSTIYTLEEDGKWTEIDVPEMPDLFWGVHAVLEFHNFLIIAADDPDHDCQIKWHVFDASTFKWSKIQSMKTYRTEFALVHDDRYLYALGGSANADGDKPIDSIERYDPGTNTWTVMKTKLPKPLCKHSACVCSGAFFSIYVVGGWNKCSYEGEYSTAMNCFNPYEESAKWHRKAPMIIPNECYVMREMVFDGKDPAIIIMCDDLVIQYYDLRTDKWSLWHSSIARLDIDWQWHQNGTVLSDASENTLYVLNICENFPGTTKEPACGVCGKWLLNKPGNAILGSPVKKFPIKAGCWGPCAHCAPNYVAAMLAIPRTSTRMIPTASATASRSKAKARAKRSIQKI